MGVELQTLEEHVSNLRRVRDEELSAKQREEAERTGRQIAQQQAAARGSQQQAAGRAEPEPEDITGAEEDPEVAKLAPELVGMKTSDLDYYT